MLNQLLSLATNPILSVEPYRDLYISSLYFLSINKQRKFKHGIQSLTSSLVKEGHINLSSQILNILTSDSISQSIKQHSVKSSNITQLADKRTETLTTIEASFEYIPNSLFKVCPDYTYHKNADLAALCVITLACHPGITRKDLERLAQKYISFFPSLSNSNAWDARYSSSRSLFTIFSSELLRKLLKHNYCTQKNSTFSLTELGTALCEYIEEQLTVPLSA